MEFYAGNVYGYDVDGIDRVIRKAEKVVGKPLIRHNDILRNRDIVKLDTILSDTTHPLRQQFTDRHLNSGRFRVPKIARERYKRSFVPRVIIDFNKNFRRGVPIADL